MPDVYATIADADLELQSSLAAVLEIRAADPQQRAMLEEYTAALELPAHAAVLEVGCGTGAVCRYLNTLPNAGSVTGVDPSPLFIERARELAGDIDFRVGDGRALDLPDASFDAVVFHTALCHVPERERALAEAHRVLRPGGQLAIFDGDYVTMTFARTDDDPLQCCAVAGVHMLVHDPWLMRGLAALLDATGFTLDGLRGHAYTTATGTDYFAALVGRGADALQANGTIGPDLAAALKAEGRRRMDSGTFFGHIAYASAIARRRQAAAATGG